MFALKISVLLKRNVLIQSLVYRLILILRIRQLFRSRSGSKLNIEELIVVDWFRMENKYLCYEFGKAHKLSNDKLIGETLFQYQMAKVI